MSRFVLFKDSSGNHHVCKSKLVKNDPSKKMGYLVEDLPIVVLAFNGKFIFIYY